MKLELFAVALFAAGVGGCAGWDETAREEANTPGQGSAAPAAANQGGVTVEGVKLVEVEPTVYALADTIIVKFRPSVTEAAECIHRDGRFASATNDRSGSLDELSERHRVLSVRPLFRQAINCDAARSVQPSGPVDMSSVYVLDLARGENVVEASRAFASDPHVQYAHPDYWVTTATGGQR